VALPDHEPDAAEHRETLLRATRERTPCAILYLKPGGADAEARVIHPYALVHAQGTWYVVAHCSVREGVRLFRVDRVLEAAPADATFDVPDDFRLEDWVRDGRAYRADGDADVRIRYSGRIARWIRERAALDDSAVTDEPDGSVIVRHRVADPSWALEEVLRYGTEAEVLEPEELRALVREVAGRMG
jgi:predicted DNA-binding transcriptional regulator YafY